MAYSVNVRTIAETYFEGGDIIGGLAAIDRIQEGLTAHLMRQNTYTDEYRAEVPVKLELTIDGIALCVQGRVDGLMLKDASCLVEEIKTTRLPPSAINIDDYPVHWAQAQIYAFMLCRLNAFEYADVRLVYMDLTGEKVQFLRSYSSKKLEELFFTYVQVYIDKLKRREDWLGVSIPSVNAGEFPFDSFREGQRELAAQTYRCIRDRSRLLCQAPTGIGKTAATLFPAIKALGQGLTDTIFYLTARGTGRIAAEDTLALMRARGVKIRSVSISAKRKLCPTPACRCDPEFCPRAKGHFDRQKLALEASWSESAFDESAIKALSDKYALCPFELALSLSETAQVITCDYNYVFDPAVRLKRFFDRAGRYTLLIDEAHNLPERAREMYSAEVGYNDIKELRREVGKSNGRESELYLALSGIMKTLGTADECGLESELPLRTVEALKSFMDAAKPWLGAGLPCADRLSDFYFEASAFVRASGEFDESCCKLMVLPEGKRNRLRLWCWDPTPRLLKTLKRMCGAVMFSATLSPIEHYAKLLGVDADGKDRLLDLRSPFPEKNLLRLRLDIPTRYSVRAESALRVAKAIHVLCLSKPGNYLACFPSHAYLELVYEAFCALSPRVDAIKQEARMDERARLAYLARFSDKPESSMAAFIAMGGVFSEGIDLPGEKLIGAAIVGVGLPQIGFERDALRAMYDSDNGEGGFETAYMYPGIGKCLQAAGRVIRSASDKGAVLFIDERYARPEYERLLPAHMKPTPVSESALPEALKKFWREADARE